MKARLLFTLALFGSGCGTPDGQHLASESIASETGLRDRRHGSLSWEPTWRETSPNAARQRSVLVQKAPSRSACIPSRRKRQRLPGGLVRKRLVPVKSRILCKSIRRSSSLFGQAAC